MPKTQAMLCLLAIAYAAQLQTTDRVEGSEAAKATPPKPLDAFSSIPLGKWDFAKGDVVRVNSKDLGVRGDNKVLRGKVVKMSDGSADKMPEGFLLLEWVDPLMNWADKPVLASQLARLVNNPSAPDKPTAPSMTDYKKGAEVTVYSKTDGKNYHGTVAWVSDGASYPPSPYTFPKAVTEKMKSTKGSVIVTYKRTLPAKWSDPKHIVRLESTEQQLKQYDNGNVFLGKLQDGKRQGKGILFRKNGKAVDNVYEGEWENDEVVHGSGALTVFGEYVGLDGDKYVARKELGTSLEVRVRPWVAETGQDLEELSFDEGGDYGLIRRPGDDITPPQSP